VAVGVGHRDVAIKFGGNQRRGLAIGDPERRPMRLHYVVVKDGDKGLEILRMPLWGNGEARYVLVRRYGLDDRDHPTLAAELDLSRERVRQLQREAEFLLRSGANARAG
jgi:Sigma-70, region 4